MNFGYKDLLTCNFPFSYGHYVYGHCVILRREAHEVCFMDCGENEHWEMLNCVTVLE